MFPNLSKRILKISPWLTLQIFLVLTTVSAQLHKKLKPDNVVAEMQVVCHSDSIVLKVNTNTPFNGMLYAKDAPASNNCMVPFNSATNMTFRLPLKSCGTSSAEVDDGIEYFNTIVVQPHMRLMTNQGKGYHVRCKYQTRERTIANTHFNVRYNTTCSAAFLMQNGPQTPSTPLLATASMPSCTMKIYRSGGHDDVAETVKIGDKLIMVIEIDQQDMYGMKITNCVVRDGLNKAAQELINDVGCPVDENIMPKFEYSHNYTRAAVSFPAHKFPHTSSVYYQCNVRLCINNGGCDVVDCTANSSSLSSSSSSSTSSSSSSSSHASLSASASNSSPLLSTVQGLNGTPRRKRFVAHLNHSPVAQVQSSAALEPSSPDFEQQQQQQVAALPVPSELRSSPSSRDGPSTDMSFDVYSGLYVNDIEADESDQQQVASPSKSANNSDSQQQRNGGQPTSDGVCVTGSKAGVMVLLASLASAGLVLLVACQIGLVSSGSSSEASLVGSNASHQRHLSSPLSTSAEVLNSAHNYHQHYLPTSHHRSHFMQVHSPRGRPNNKHLFGIGILS